ncbi:MAG: hypothetical protein Q8R48_02965 [Candidatus Omnitrophota bacterium]|nr:hypothetical protein [Candidatus Omnitrophota bacterium]
MKHFLNWQVVFGIILVALSGMVYFIHYLIFRDARHIFIYLIGDIAFVFIEVLLVTLVLHELLVYREKKSMLKKLNMVIGAFFSEVGTELMTHFIAFDSRAAEIAKHLVVKKDWPGKEFIRMRNRVASHSADVYCRKGDIAGLKDFLIKKRGFLLMLLENPNLLEHESFTNLLWATFHLTEELASRKNLKSLSDTDAEHLDNDIKRTYKLLVSEWLAYMGHLKADYPYLFSLAMRTNPFDPDASVEVR